MVDAVEMNLAVVRRLHAVWNDGDLTVVPDLYAPDFVGHWPSQSPIPQRLGHEGVAMGVRRIRAAFPDWTETIEDLFGAGDRVVSRYVSTGTHRGEFEGLAPTGRRIALPEMSIYRLVDGRVAEQWCLFDGEQRRRQLQGLDAR